MAVVIDGKKVAGELLIKVSEQINELKANNIDATLAVIVVGNNPASRVYVDNKKRCCEQVGIRSLEFKLPEDVSSGELLSLINELNDRNDVSGILCQLPLPGHIDERDVIAAIKPEKDVDAFHPQNVGHIMIGDFEFLPCTPAGIMELLKSTGISAEGKNCVIIGRSNIVGKPMAMLLLKENGTVTVCHSKTKNLAEITKTADILVAAVGRAKMIGADMVKEGAVVIDVGMNRDENGKLCGDVDFAAVSEIAGYITPVPGGVGPMTVAMLMQNTATAAKINNR